MADFLPITDLMNFRSVGRICQLDSQLDISNEDYIYFYSFLHSSVLIPVSRWKCHFFNHKYFSWSQVTTLRMRTVITDTD